MMRDSMTLPYVFKMFDKTRESQIFKVTGNERWCCLSVMGQNASLEVHEFGNEGIRSLRISNDVGRIGDQGQAKDNDFAAASLVDQLYGGRQNIEFCLGIGFGKRIREIKRIDQLPGLAKLHVKMQVFDDDDSRAILVIDKNLLIRNAKIYVKNSQEDRSIFEISTSGNSNSQNGYKLAAAGSLKQIGLLAATGSKGRLTNRVIEDFEISDVSLNFEVRDQHIGRRRSLSSLDHLWKQIEKNPSNSANQIRNR